MPKYRKISPRMWIDAKFRRLSPLAPSGQALWLNLLCGDHTGIIPGFICVGEAALAESLGWSLKAFREAFAEVLAEGMAEGDWEARFVWLPNALKYNEPENPNVAKSWGKAAEDIPECELAQRAVRAVCRSLRGKGDAYEKAFVEGLPEAFTKGFAKDFAESEAEAVTEAVAEAEAGGERVGSADCPYDKLLALWESSCPENPKPVELSPPLKKQVRARWVEHPDMDWWKRYFDTIAASDFLTGKVHSNGREPFVASLHWVTGPKNMAKVLSGDYGRRSLRSRSETQRVYDGALSKLQEIRDREKRG